jgi:hypothetical protein
MDKAYKDGYRRGVEDAATIAASNFGNIVQFETTYNTLDKLRTAILALTETLTASQPNPPQPQHNAGTDAQTIRGE